jgi:hypothetical protein
MLASVATLQGYDKLICRSSARSQMPAPAGSYTAARMETCGAPNDPKRSPARQASGFGRDPCAMEELSQWKFTGNGDA